MGLPYGEVVNVTETDVKALSMHEICPISSVIATAFWLGGTFSPKTSAWAFTFAKQNPRVAKELPVLFLFCTCVYGVGVGWWGGGACVLGHGEGLRRSLVWQLPSVLTFFSGGFSL